MTAPTLLQTIHVAPDGPRLVGEHVTLLDRASRALFGRHYIPDTETLTRRIAALVARECYPVSYSSFVQLEISSDGEERLLAAGGSLYKGYALRSLTPEARCVECTLTRADLPTPARHAATGLADQLARREGASLAVCVAPDGTLCMADNAPLFAIRGRELLAGPGIASVERDLVLRIAPKAQLTHSEESLHSELLPHLDELFYVDHRGITALGRCDGYPLMSLLAERLARTMEAEFAKK